MKLIIGLGNPGQEYANTRHNMGFIVLDALAEKYGLSFYLEPKFKGMLANIQIGGQKALLLKPMTYMNLSGESVVRVMQYYKINPEDILVISDDLDSRLGRVRIREKGSAGGHNGHKNIAGLLKTEEYKRIKIGIDRNSQYSVVDWVLKKFTAEELEVLKPSVEKAVRAIEDFIGNIEFYRISSLYSSK